MAAAPFDRALVRELARIYARAAVEQLLAEANDKAQRVRCKPPRSRNGRKKK